METTPQYEPAREKKSSTLFEVKIYTGRWDHNPPPVHEGDTVRVPHSGDPWRLENQPDAREWHKFHTALRAAKLFPVFFKTSGSWDYFELVKM